MTNHIKKKVASRNFGILLVSINLMTAAVCIILLIVINIVPNKYLIPIVVILFLPIAAVLFTQISGRGSNVGKLVSLFMSIIFIYSMVSLFKIQNMILEISDADEKSDMGNKTEAIHDDAVIKENYTAEGKDIQAYVDGFMVYISGIDTYGTISHTSRSDLNIVAAVNTSAKKILFINTPRDYYVMIPVDGGQMDKLTHAGIYGIDVSIETLEKLYDIQIDYYVRINLTSLNDVVDALGGIDVESEYAFETIVDAIDASSGIIITPEYGFNAVEKYSFSKGLNHLNGKAAMAFARERYAFTGGDRQRGRNQMLVIKAILNKAVSPAVIPDIVDIIDAVSKNFETNMSSGEITSLIKMQMNDGAVWDIMMYGVEGTGDSKTTYSAGEQRLYVMIPNESTVNAAREKMMEVMNSK